MGKVGVWLLDKRGLQAVVEMAKLPMTGDINVYLAAGWARGIKVSTSLSINSGYF